MEVEPAVAGPNLDLLALNEALEQLERQDARKAKLVKLRFFAGLTTAQVAQVLAGRTERDRGSVLLELGLQVALGEGLTVIGIAKLELACVELGARVVGREQRVVKARVALDGEDLVLDVGEAAEFDTQLPHWFGSTGDGPAEVLSIFGRPGERMHVRARPDDDSA